MTKPNLNFIFDIERIKFLKNNAVKTSQKDNLIINLIENEITSRLTFTKKDFKCIFIYGEFSNNLLKFLEQRYPNTVLTATANIISSPPISGASYHPTVCYEDQLPFSNQAFDLAISCASFHRLNNIPKALKEYRRILKPDGFFLSSFVGGITLHEARESLLQAEIALTGGASPRIIPMVDLATAAELMQYSGFSLPVVDRDLLNLSYSSLTTLFEDVKHLGEGNYMIERSLKMPKKNLFKVAEQFYRQHYLDEHQRLKATLELIHLCGWNPEQSQPKNCSKGAEQVSLTEILGS